MLVERKRPAGMLLNQCLAISLSPLATEVREFARTSAPKDERVCDERRAERRSEVSLFRQLIERNCPARNTSENSEDDAEPENSEAHDVKNVRQLDERKQCQLREALLRVEFAGFVVPSWLLLSGSYNDLHCIKTSWSEGQLRPPAGFKIETIGKFSQRALGAAFLLLSPIEIDRASGAPTGGWRTQRAVSYRLDVGAALTCSPAAS